MNKNPNLLSPGAGSQDLAVIAEYVQKTYHLHRRVVKFVLILWIIAMVLPVALFLGGLMMVGALGSAFSTAAGGAELMKAHQMQTLERDVNRQMERMQKGETPLPAPPAIEPTEDAKAKARLELQRSIGR